MAHVLASDSELLAGGLNRAEMKHLIDLVAKLLRALD